MTKFVIMMEGRVGSSYLYTLLNDHPQIHCFHEKFIEDSFKGNVDKKLEWLQWLFHDKEGKKETAKSCGFKTKFRDCDPKVLKQLEEDQVKIIYLSRTNQVKLALSLYNYMDHFHGTKKANFEKGEKTFEAKTIDPKRLQGLIKSRTKQEEILQNYIFQTPLDVLHITYENLMHHAQETLSDIYQFLGVEESKVSSDYIKATPDNLKEAIVNYDDVKTHFDKFHFSEMLEEDFDYRAKKTTIVTLFSGRWHTLEAYMTGLMQLDCDPKTVNIVWYTNADEVFVEVLHTKAHLLRECGFSVNIYHDTSIPLASNIYDESGHRSEQDLAIGAALYNAAWQHVKTDDVLIVDDDVIITSHTLKRLQKQMKDNFLASVIGVCVFDRYQDSTGRLINKTMSWHRDLKIVKNEDEQKYPYIILHPEKEPWGLKKVGVVSFSCVFIRRSRLPIDIQFMHLPFLGKSAYDVNGHLTGVDVDFCLRVEDFGRHVYCENDIRAYHFDSRGCIH